jgi:hypothetical protein
MPVINGEASYEMLGDSLPTQWTRAMFWLCMTNGAAGHTYGANGIWQCNRKGQPHGPSPHHKGGNGYGILPWDEAMNLPGARQIGEGKAWLEKFPWWRFEPHPEWIAWDAGAAQSVPVVPPYATGLADGPRLFYLLDPRPVVVRSLQPNKTFQVTHFDPVEGKELDGGKITADDKGEVHLPAPSHGHDDVILLQPAQPTK